MAPHSSFLVWEIPWTVEPGGLQSESASEVAQLCATICDPIDCSLPGSSVHGIFQAKVLEWVAISLSRGSSWPRDRIQFPALQADALASEPLGKPGYSLCGCKELHMTEQLTHTWMLFTTETKLEQEKEETRIPIFKSHVNIPCKTYCQRALSFREFFLELFPSLGPSSSSVSRLRLQLLMIWKMLLTVDSFSEFFKPFCPTRCKKLSCPL